MVFQWRATKDDYKFHIGNETIEIVQNYTYLGTRISSTRNFTISLNHLREKALHALFSLRRHVDFSSLKPSFASKIFDIMISPILTYNSEVWGVYTKSDFKSWENSPIEKNTPTVLQTLPMNVEVSNKASNIACRAELGRFPLIIDINKRMLNYVTYLRNKDQDSIFKQSLLTSIDLHSHGKSSFIPISSTFTTTMISLTSILAH